MKLKKIKLIHISFKGIFSLLSAFSLFFVAAMPISAEKLLDRYGSFYNTVTDIVEKLPDYRDVLAEAKENGYSAAKSAIIIDLNKYTAKGENHSLQSENGKYILKTADNTSVSFPFVVKESGLYELEVTYRLKDALSVAKRGILIDGKAFFNEAESAFFYPTFKLLDKKEYDEQGNQLLMQTETDSRWQTVRLRDSGGRIALPLSFALDSGSHTLTLNFVEEDMEIAYIAFVPPTEIKSYKAVSKEYNKNHSPKESVFIEAEDPKNIVFTNSSTLIPYSDTDPKMTPEVKQGKIFNAMGGNAWNIGGQEIDYRFEVKEAGLYKIATRFIQNWGNGATSYRRIEIDGKVPFNEFLTYPFKHSTKWHAEPLADKSGSPYLVYLEKGEHTISFTAVTSEEISNATTLISAVQEDLGVLYRKIIMITGTVPDPNYVYELDESIPELLSEFDRMIKSLEESRKLISEFQSGSANDNNIKMIIQQLTEMKNKPDGIAQKLDMFTDAMNTLSNLSSTMVESPLAFDSIEFLPPDAEVSSKESSFFARLAVMVRTFLNSFNKDYTVATTQHENTINVWVSRGSEWAELMKELIRSDFEPQNNCAVKLNVLPSGSINGASTNPLLMAIASGRAPDVVINVDCTLPVEYGIRGVALDLSEFSGYKELTENYVPGIMNAFTFLDKVYGVPETMTFQSLIYRKDIFTELGLSVPNTWDEVYYQLLPVLYQNNLQMSAVGFDTLLYQNNGKYYTEDGLKVTLDNAVAHNAFEMYINQFHDLGFPIVANFFNRFRTGEMPIGFADYGTYLQMLTGAPELTGKWELAPMPGVRQEDGSIRRTTTSLCIASNVILSATKKPDLSFEFIKWWASTDIQVRYGLRLESRLGKGARWNPANINAYNDLPWNQSDLEVIYKAWNEAVAVPYVLGGIITGREVGNATNNALFNNVTPRKSLEKANKNINDELIRKQKMYNIETGDNNE